MEEKVAGQPLEDIAGGRHEQAAADGGKRVKLLEAAPDASLTFLRSHVPGVEIADHPQILLRVRIVHPPLLLELVPHGSAPPGGGHVEEGHGRLDLLQEGQGLVEKLLVVAVQPEHRAGLYCDAMAMQVGHGFLVSSHLIKAFALGAHYLYPSARMVIDIGGQDTKVIALTGDGSFENFAINDRCAAGTGRFLEVMAHSFEIEIGEFGSFALMAGNLIKINSMCTVFAESEVISLLAKGEDPRSIALGIHQSIVERIEPMVNRVGAREPILFAGGGALNPCLANLLRKRLGSNLIIPENPQIVGALGAALHGSKEYGC